jgi:hypothetical protein
VTMERYGHGISEKNVKPERDKDGVLIKKNMQVRKAQTTESSDTSIKPFIFLSRLYISQISSEQY